MAIKLKKQFFVNIHKTRFNISLVKENQYVMLELKYNKTDVDHSRVSIMLAAIAKATYLVAIFR